MKDSKFSRVLFNTYELVLIHNFGRGRGSLLAKLGLSTDGIQSRKDKRDSTTPAKKEAKRRRTGDVPGTSYAPGGY